MTKLSPGKKLTRETAALHRGTPLVIDLHPRHIAMRVKGERSFVVVDYDAIFDLGQKLASRRLLAEKSQTRKRRTTP